MSILKEGQKARSFSPTQPRSAETLRSTVGRNEVGDAKNNERHVCGRARVGERPVSEARRTLFGTLSF